MEDQPFNPFQAPQMVGRAPVQPLTPQQRIREMKHMNQIKQCRGLLIFVGVLTIAINGWSLFNSRAEAQLAADAHIRRVQLQPGEVVVPEKREQMIDFLQMFAYFIYCSLMAVGVIDILLAIAVTKFPVPATIAAMVLFLVANGVVFYLNPEAIAGVAIYKIIFLFSLGKAIRSAFAYQREVRNRIYQPVSAADDTPPWLKPI